jgi:hypothetical protein
MIWKVEAFRETVTNEAVLMSVVALMTEAEARGKGEMLEMTYLALREAWLIM